MFSYGMVLYELLTGKRPLLGHHQLQIAKKLSKGVRPLLGSPEEVQFFCLQTLLTECWDTKPEKVGPLALSHICISDRIMLLNPLTFATFRHKYDLKCQFSPSCGHRLQLFVILVILTITQEKNSTTTMVVV